MSNTTNNPFEGVSNKTSVIEYVNQLETQVRYNLTEIDDLHRFIDNVCQSNQDKIYPFIKIEELEEENEDLKKMISEFYNNNLIWRNSYE